MNPCTSMKSFFTRLFLSFHTTRVIEDLGGCIDRVQSYRKDLQFLIHTRNKQHVQLEKRPEALARINDVIESARDVLIEASIIVESCQMNLHQGKMALHKKMEWTFKRSVEYRNLEQRLSFDHAAVLTECNYLKQLIMYTYSDPWMNEEMARANMKKPSRARLRYDHIPRQPPPRQHHSGGGGGSSSSNNNLQGIVLPSPGLQTDYRLADFLI